MIHAILFLAALIAIVPVLRVISVSLRPENRLLDPELDIIPRGRDARLLRARAVRDRLPAVALQQPDHHRRHGSLVGLIFAATSAYGFSRFAFPGRGVGLTALLATQLIPATMLLVPIFILAIQLDLVGTYRGLVIAYAVTSVPFSIWILKGYYDTVPVELEEAARIDGCSQLEAFWRVLLPLSTPALAIVFLFNFLAAWNEFVLARDPHRLADRPLHLAARASCASRRSSRRSGATWRRHRSSSRSRSSPCSSTAASGSISGVTARRREGMTATRLGDPPAWVADAVFYQIFPDRFARSGRVPAPGPLEAWDDAAHGQRLQGR